MSSAFAALIDALSLCAGAGMAVIAAMLVISMLGLRSAIASPLALWCIGLAQIVLLSEVLSEFGAIGRPGFLIGHAAIVATAWCVWRWRGRPSPLAPLRDIPAAVSAIVRNPILLALIGAVAIVHFYGLVQPALVPVYSGDAYAYHIPRAYFWWQNATARPFPTNDFRQTQFPPNSSFVVMWTMILSGGYALVHVLQWSAAIAASGAVMGLARIAGFSRPAAVFTGLLLPLYPLVVYEAGTAQNDVAVAALLLIVLYFALRATTAFEQRRSWQPDATVMGIAAGVVTGMKYSFVYFAIPAALCLGGYALVRMRSRALPLLGALGFAVIAGITLLGAYQYVLNWYDIGHPLYNEYHGTWVARNRTPENSDVFGTIFRSVYATLDWVGIFPSESRFLYRQVDLLKSIMTALGLDPEQPPSFVQFRYQTLRPASDVSGFGVVPFACLVLSLVLGAALLVRLMVARKLAPQWQVRLLYLGIGWGTFLCFAVLLYWDKWYTRFLLAAVALITAAVLPLVYERRLLRYAVLLPLSGVLVAGAWHAAFHIEGRSFGATWAALIGAPRAQARDGDKIELATGLLRDNFPAGARIGLIGGPDTAWFSIIRALPQLRFESVRADTAFARLQQGDLAALLVDDALYGDRSDVRRLLKIPETGDHPSLVLPGMTSVQLLVRNPRDFLAANLGRYGLSPVASNQGPALLIDNPRALMDLPGHWKPELAFSVPHATGDQVVLLPLTAAPDIGADPGRVVCIAPRRGRAYDGSARLTPTALLLRLPAEGTADADLFHRCVWRPAAASGALLQLDTGEDRLRQHARAHGFMLLGAPGLLVSVGDDAAWPTDRAIQDISACLLTAEATTRCAATAFGPGGTAAGH